VNSSRPYLIRAIYQWIVDNGCTPQILVDVQCEGVQVPMQFAANDQIVLNIAPAAVKNLELGDEWVRFNARFNAKPHDVIVPVQSIQAMMARENGVGMSFPTDDYKSPPPKDEKPTRPSLKLVK